MFSSEGKSARRYVMPALALWPHAAPVPSHDGCRDDRAWLGEMNGCDQHNSAWGNHHGGVPSLPATSPAHGLTNIRRSHQPSFEIFKEAPMNSNPTTASLGRLSMLRGLMIALL